MVHIFNALYFLILITGILAFFHVYRISDSDKSGTARPYSGFIMFWNLAVLEMFIFGYLKAGVFDTAAVTTWPIVIIVWDSLLRIVAAVGSTYFFIKIVQVQFGRSPSQRVKFFYAAALIPISFLFGVCTAVFSAKGDSSWLTTAQNALVSSALVLMGLSSVYLLGRGKKIPEPLIRKAVRTFGGFYAVVFLILANMHIFALWSRAAHILMALLYLMMNGFPLVWCRRFFLLVEEKEFFRGESEALESITLEYQLTQREKKVFKLILSGASNREIQNTLFISLSTVKNHIYNLFRKLEVKSRGQLIRFFREKQKNG